MRHPLRSRSHQRFRLPTVVLSAVGSMVALTALVLSPVLSAGPAGAAGCAAGWTVVNGTICELRVTTSGTVTIPAEATKVDVMVVGGGGGGGAGYYYPTDNWVCGWFGCGQVDPHFSYAGGGGSGGQVVCKGMALSGTVAVTIGDGGAGGISPTYPAAIADPGGTGGTTTVDTCTALGGKGGGSSKSVGTTQINGEGGDSGSGVLGRKNVNGPGTDWSGGGGAGAANPPDSRYSDGGRPSSPTGACFTGTTEQWAAGGGAGVYEQTLIGNGFSWETDPATGFTKGVASGANVGTIVQRYPAHDGLANSGNGGGGGNQIPPTHYPDATFYYDAIGHDGGDGGSGVAILRYSTSGDPTFEKFDIAFASIGRPYEYKITGTGFNCLDSVTVGGIACTSLTPVSDTQIKCVVPDIQTSGPVDVVITTSNGSVTAPKAFCYYATNISQECFPAPPANGAGDAGGGDAGTADGIVEVAASNSGTGTSGGTLPLTGKGSGTEILLVVACALLLSGGAMHLFTRRRDMNLAFDDMTTAASVEPDAHPAPEAQAGPVVRAVTAAVLVTSAMVVLGRRRTR